MKIVHVADLHFGKEIHGVKLIEEKDQPYWVKQFVLAMKAERPDVIAIAGDVYDRSAPSKEAVKLLDKMLTELTEALPDTQIMVVAGNHDSGDRLSFGSRLLKKQHLYISGNLERALYRETFTDAYGEVTFYLMPYVFPALVNQVLGTEYREYDPAVRALLAEQNIDFSKRNVIIAHQNVLALGKEAERGGSETMVGGVGGIDYSAFDGFEYVALGHIHAAQAMGRAEVRYAGSPLCYHFDETKHPQKGPVVITLGEKGTPAQIRIIDIPALHPMRIVEGTKQEIIDRETDNGKKNEYIKIVLDEERRSIETDAAIRAVFEAKGSKVLDTMLKAQDARTIETSASAKALKEKPVEELFSDFWTEKKGESPDEMYMELIQFVAEQIRNSDMDQSEPTSDQVKEIIHFALGQEASH